MKTQTIFLLLATLSTGLMAGVFFTWSNAVTTGLALLKDIEYLRAFQAMNRTILIPTFFLAIFGPVLLLPLSVLFHFKTQPTSVFWILLAAALFYVIGVVIVTIAGNVPLNTILDESTLETFSLEDARLLREGFENKWNSLNWIRTYCSLSSFLLLIISCLLTKP